MPLEFTEYKMGRPCGTGVPQLPVGNELATQSLAIGGVSVQSAAFQPATDLVVISKVDADCRVAFGPNPVAAAGRRFVRAGSEYAFQVQPGEKIAVIAA